MGKTTLSVLVALLGLTMAGGAARAVERSGPLPPSLRPWVAWVLDSDEAKQASCPSPAGASAPVCAWPSRLTLDLRGRSGIFAQTWTTYRPGFVALPGDKAHWPREVKVDGRRAPIVDDHGTPKVRLPGGRHQVTGAFLWDSLPEALIVPSETGLLSLAVEGRPVRFPMREGDGRVFLGKQHDEAAEEERVDISVYRKLSDTTPQLLTTRMTLAVSGKSRELLLARALPDGFAPRAVESELPLRFEADHRVRVQARPGVWTLAIVGHKVAAAQAISRPMPDGLWQGGDEVWAFEAVPDLRTVTVTGVPTIDPAQTLMPSEWKHLPAYVLAPGAALVLVEQRRGDAQPAPERLTLRRTLWLDEDGGGYSVHDAIAGELTRSWRLEVGQRMRLGRLAVDGQDQFITAGGSWGGAGVELRSGRATIDADSRIEGRGLALPVTGFAHDFDQLSATLQLPAGWDLLHASGPDQVIGSWVDRWSLGQLLLLLFLVLAIGRLYGWRLGAVALSTLGLTLPETQAPALLWLLVLGGEALVRALPSGPVLVGARLLRAALWGLLVVVSLPFALNELRFAMHPSSAMDPPTPGWLAELMAPPNREISLDVLQANSRFVSYLAKPPEERAEQVPEWLKKGGPERQQQGLYGLRHKGEEGKLGARGNEERRRLAEAAAKNAGILGVLKAPASDPRLASVFGRAEALGGVSAEGSGFGGMPPTEARPATGVGGHAAESTAVAPSPSKPALYDPSIIVQTGEGLPRKAWRAVLLGWNGPVQSGQQVRLYLLPPWLGRLLALAQVALLGLLVWLLVRRPLRLRGAALPPRPLLAGLVLLALLVPLSASAEAFPPDEMLDELKERLLPGPECAPDCVAINDMSLDVSPAWLRVRLAVSAAAPSAIALPGDLGSWTPTEVRVDGRSATALERGADGRLWLALAAGIFNVDLSGPLPARDSIQLPLPMPPRRATSKARGFEVHGIHEDGAVDDSISLTRTASTIDGKPDFAEGSPTLPPFLRVERTLKLALKWEVETRVTRETSASAPLIAEVPLLPGESVTTAGIIADKERAVVSLGFAPGETEKLWRSTLAETRTIHLRAEAKTAARWSEVWRLELSPIWHATFTGIPAVRVPAGGPVRVPEWRPWPGEEVHIAVERPSGAPGRTLTIDASTLDIQPGLRSTEVALTLELRSSRGTDHAIVLPAGAEVMRVERDHVSQAVRQAGQALTLAIPPGKTQVGVHWRQPGGVATLFRTPSVDLQLPSSNATVNIGLQAKPRWLLWLGGPALGPIVGTWPVAVLVLLVSVLLARTRLTPLRTHHFLLLGLGLTQVSLLPALLVPAVLLGLGLRARQRPNDARPALFDAAQVTLVVLLLVSLGTLVGAVDSGLARFPDVFLMGNQPSPDGLAWLTARSGALLPRPFVLSVPMWAYRAAVVAWALWLVVAVIRWSPWGWSCLKQHGLWRPLAKPITLPPA